MAGPTFYEGQVLESVDGSGPDLVRRGNKWVPVGAVGSTGGATLGAPKLTEAQAKDGFNAKRMSGAESVIDPLEQKGFDAGKAQLIPGFLPGFDDKRKYESAQYEWADSLLRMTTGAAATKDEIHNAVNTYFPKLGDSPQVRQQKADMRRRVQQDAMTRAGPAGVQSAPQARMGSTGRTMAADAQRSRNAFAPAGQASTPAAKRLRFNPQTGQIE